MIIQIIPTIRTRLLLLFCLWLAVLTSSCSFWHSPPKNKEIVLPKTEKVAEQSSPPKRAQLSRNGKGLFMLISYQQKKDSVSFQRGMAVTVYSDAERIVLLTNRHLVKHGKVKVWPWMAEPCTATSCQKKYTATPIALNKEIDVALLEIKGLPPVPYRQLASIRPKPGTPIRLYGQPAPNLGTITSGIVSAYRKVSGQGRLMMSDAFTTPGFSGGGVFDDKDNLVGLITGRTQDKRGGFSYIIPSDQLKIFLDTCPKFKQQKQ